MGVTTNAATCLGGRIVCLPVGAGGLPRRPGRSSRGGCPDLSEKLGTTGLEPRQQGRQRTRQKGTRLIMSSKNQFPQGTPVTPAAQPENSTNNKRPGARF